MIPVVLRVLPLHTNSSPLAIHGVVPCSGFSFSVATAGVNAELRHGELVTTYRADSDTIILGTVIIHFTFGIHI